MYKKALPWLTQLIVTALLPFSFLGLHFGNLSVLSWWDLNTFRRERWKCPAHPAPGLRWWCAWPASAASTRSLASITVSDQLAPVHRHRRFSGFALQFTALNFEPYGLHWIFLSGPFFPLNSATMDRTCFWSKYLMFLSSRYNVSWLIWPLSGTC